MRGNAMKKERKAFGHGLEEFKNVNLGDTPLPHSPIAFGMSHLPLSRFQEQCSDGSSKEDFTT